MTFQKLSISAFLTCLLVFTAPSSAWALTRVLVLGDSLTEGYGLAKDDAFPALVEKKLKAAGKDVEIINAGISGSTTASATGRLRWQLRQKIDVVVFALGANDGLRGLSVAEAKKNLSSAIELAKKNNIKVLLTGMRVPPNYGKKYSEDFEKIFSELAREHKVSLMPFLLEGVAGDAKLNLPDGIHPNEKGYVKIADNVAKHLEKLL